MSDALLESWITLAREMEHQRDAARALVREAVRHLRTAQPVADLRALLARIDAQPWAREGT
jgi:uncharacterized membrane protein